MEGLQGGPGRWNALGQFLPAVVVGTMVTAALVSSPDTAALLPGLWALVYALGLFSSRLHLPRAVGWADRWDEKASLPRGVP